MKRLVVLLVMTFPLCLVAQSGWKKAGGFRAMGTFSPTWMPVNGNVYYGFSGNWNYYLSEHISIQGEGTYFLNTLQTARHGLKSLHKLNGGLSWHFLSKRAFDPFVGLHPGVGFLTHYRGTNLIQVALMPENDVVPMISISGGANYYVGSVFHFFVHLRYSSARSYAAQSGLENLSELQLSLGLGLNFGVKNEGQR